MNNIFLIFGYGVPKNILKDDNFNFYLKMAFNKIYSITLGNPVLKPIIITCGGPTDMLKPYKRTEAEEMITLFKNIIQQRPFLNSITSHWEFIPEKKSLSTLENLLNSNKIIQKRKIKNANLYIFCEQTREKRIKILAKKVFSKNFTSKVMPLDFDVSPNRYLSPDFIDKKENLETRHALWALKSVENLNIHHQIFEEKFEYFRKANKKTQVNVVKEWWDKKLSELTTV